MKKIYITLPLLTISMLSMSSCGSSKSSKETLRILNWEDYIYEPESGDELASTIDQFIEYMADKGKEVDVIYDTFDTNETMLNSLKTGKTTYDLICPSDYMIQRMLSADMLEPFEKGSLDVYEQYASHYLQDAFGNIKATNSVTGEECSLSDYAVGYMWGTLGFVYNPQYSAFKDIPEEEIIEDFQSYDAIWDEKYKGAISIKDSMRDTYAVGNMHVHEEELLALQEQYNAGDLTDDEYNSKLSTIFNYGMGGESYSDAAAHIDQVKEDLLKLKNNIFGFEVDSGKEDIVTGKIGVNIAWSGDAVYSMDQAQDERGIYLNYSVPSYGGNIWFDGWCMPKSDSLNKDLAVEFINFISNPDIAALNMDFIGYTSFIAGDSILELIREWYDARTYYVYKTDENGELVEDEDGNYILNQDEEGNDLDYSSFDDAWAEENDLYRVNLSYFFNGTLEEYEDDVDTIFYSEETGRQFSAQYPAQEDIPHLAIMQDSGSNNSLLLDMWEIVKSDSLPVWAIVVFSTEIVIFGFGIGFFFIKKSSSKKRRKKRQLEAQ